MQRAARGCWTSGISPGKVAAPPQHLAGAAIKTDHKMSGKITPLYVVCSPRRCGGKTLVSRLLTEFYVLDDCPVTAFDLSDEGPQLADYLPQFTTIADINDIRGQVAFLERLIAENEGAKIIDVSHRAFKKFFMILQKIRLFEEARLHSIEPLILFIADADSKSSEAYASLRRRFTEASLLPVRNMADTSAISLCDTPSTVLMAPAALEVPLLRFSLRALVDRQHFSFAEFWRSKPENLPNSLDDQLRNWVECVFVQFRAVERVLGCEGRSTWIGSPTMRAPLKTVQDREAKPLDSNFQPNARLAAITQVLDIPQEILKFAPKKIRRAAQSMQSGII